MTGARQPIKHLSLEGSSILNISQSSFESKNSSCSTNNNQGNVQLFRMRLCKQGTMEFEDLLAFHCDNFVIEI